MPPKISAQNQNYQVFPIILIFLMQINGKFHSLKTDQQYLKGQNEVMIKTSPSPLLLDILIGCLGDMRNHRQFQQINSIVSFLFLFNICRQLAAHKKSWIHPLMVDW